MKTIFSFYKPMSAMTWQQAQGLTISEIHSCDSLPLSSAAFLKEMNVCGTLTLNAEQSGSLIPRSYTLTSKPEAGLFDFLGFYFFWSASAQSLKPTTAA
jgi:hypothetical protein